MKDSQNSLPWSSKKKLKNKLKIGNTWCDITKLNLVLNGFSAIELNSDQEFIERINSSVDFINELIEQGQTIYGVNTGYGDSCTVSIPRDLVDQLPQRLYTYHGCGSGRSLTPLESKSVVIARLISLSNGYSGVRVELLQLLIEMINRDILPVIPAEGSVGASGDLTPLSYLAAVLEGHREVYFKGEIVRASKAMQEAGLEVLKLKPKEVLALMNGTAVMTGLACIIQHRVEHLIQLSCQVTAMCCIGLQGSASSYDERLMSLKPHPGQQLAASLIRDALGDYHSSQKMSSRLQDRYSLRCAPQIIGVLQDFSPWCKQVIEQELNSTNDNPLVDAKLRKVMHGGHFYGGHIAFVMDGLKNAIANIADLHDRQLALLVDDKFNHGLPANLCGVDGRESAINHGFKAVQISASAWTAEALKSTMPASVFSRSTECHNQDKVSMGTIAARDCLNILRLTEQVLAVTLLGAIQAIKLRIKQDELEYQNLTPHIQTCIEQVEKVSPFLQHDRRMDSEIHNVVNLIQAREL